MTGQVNNKEKRGKPLFFLSSETVSKYFCDNPPFLIIWLGIFFPIILKCFIIETEENFMKNHSLR